MLRGRLMKRLFDVKQVSSSNSRARRRLGAAGEELAARELARRGYVIRERNWRCAAGEVDLVAELDGALVFVEVKTRRGNQFGAPEESITSAKRTHLIAAAQTYLQEHQWQDCAWRIDVVAIELGPQGRLRRIEVIESAVEGG